MVKRVLQQCCRPRCSNDLTASHLWISEDLVAAQWTRFAQSVRVRKAIPSRQLHSSTLSPRKQRKRNTITQSFDHQLTVKTEVPYINRRHGSAAPGPLEARKRRALQKHMTGAANLGMFGSGLDFSGSSWRVDIGRASQGMNTRGSSLYEALGMIWRWWLLDPDAPVRHENVAMPESPENAPSNSFEALLERLEMSWTHKPASVVELLESLSMAAKEDQSGRLKMVCTWITAEVSLGSMNERDINRILCSLTQQEFLVKQSTYDLGVMGCQSIAEGILKSTVRPMKYLHKDTVWLVMRSMAILGLHHPGSVNYISTILQSIAQEQPSQAARILSNILDIGVSRNYAQSKTTVLSLLQSLPSTVSIEGTLLQAQHLIRNQNKLRSSSSMQALQRFLQHIMSSDLLRGLHNRSELDANRLHFEFELSKLDILFTAAYLQSAQETDVCKYVMRNIVRGMKKITNHVRDQGQHRSLDSNSAGLPADLQTYSGLLHAVEENHPQRFRPTLQFLLQFLRITDRLSDCYKLVKYLFSSGRLRGRVSIEFFQKEVALWSKKYPLFAMILLASDRRRGVMHHPVVVSVLAASTKDVERIPMEDMLHLATVLIETHGDNLKIAAIENDLPHDSVRVLQLLLEPIAWGQCNERQAFRKAQKIIQLLAPMSSAIRKESSVAIMNIVAIRTLEARCKVPEWKLEWLAPIVTQLEGPDVWAVSLARIEQWWRAIAEEESSMGRKWKNGVGWVKK